MSDKTIFDALISGVSTENGEKKVTVEWLSFPTSKDKVSELFDKIGLPNNARNGCEDGQYCIKCFSAGNRDLTKFITEYTDIDELNYYASCLAELSDNEMTVFQAALEKEECENLTLAINIAKNTEYYNLVPDIFTYEDVGRYYYNKENVNLGGYDCYFNFELYGQEMESENGGYLGDGFYLEEGCTEWNKVYDGNTEHIPSEYCVVPKDTMTVLIVEPMKEPYTKEIGTDLKDLQREVGGMIEVVYPFAEPVGLICNEEGKNIGLPLNRALYDAEGDMYEIIAGKFVLAGLSDDSFTSLDDEQIKRLSKQFRQPEMFMKINGKIKALPVKPSVRDSIKRMTEKTKRQEPKKRKPPEQSR